MQIKAIQTPSLRFLTAATIAFCLALSALYVSLNQPRYAHGFRLNDRLRSADQESFVKSLDLTAEPGEIGEQSTLDEFYQRQDLLTSILRSKSLLINEQPVSLLSKREAVSSLPAVFWVQLAVGLGAFLIAAWVWALRRGDRAALLFFWSGLSTLVFTFSAAIYSCRDLAMPAGLFRLLVKSNVAGACAFGIVVINLFFIYPQRKTFSKTLCVGTSLFFALWTFGSLCEILPPWAGVNLITLTEMIGIGFAIGLQFLSTKKDPTARATLTWLGLSVICGAGLFIALNAIPIVLNHELAIDQGYAFLSFLFLYLGLAAGITRYRLFEVGDWAFRFLFYGCGALALFLIDGLLIYKAGTERLPAFAFSLFAVSLLYLPLHDALRRKLLKQIRLKDHELLKAILKITFASSPIERHWLWRNLLIDLYAPLQIRELMDPVLSPKVLHDGITLVLPNLGLIPALELSYRSAGRALFSKDSLALARQLVDSMELAETNRNAYDRGIREERQRITQDLHDDVGASLLTILNQAEGPTRSSIQVVMTDLRNIVNEMSEEDVSLGTLLADLRFETVNRLHALGIKGIWPLCEDHSSTRLGYHEHKVLRSGVRELMSNVIRHAKASQVIVTITLNDGLFRFAVADDGEGLDEETLKAEKNGLGLRGLTRKLNSMGGRFNLTSSMNGTCCEIVLPYQSKAPIRRSLNESPRAWLPHDLRHEVSDRLS